MNCRAWAALCQVLALTDLLNESRMAAMADRRIAEHELDERTAASTPHHEKAHSATELQLAGITAAPLLDSADIAHSDVMRRSGMIVELDHPAVGRHEYGALAFRHSRTPGAPQYCTGLQPAQRRDTANCWATTTPAAPTFATAV